MDTRQTSAIRWAWLASQFRLMLRFLADQARRESLPVAIQLLWGRSRIPSNARVGQASRLATNEMEFSARGLSKFGGRDFVLGLKLPHGLPVWKPEIDSIELFGESVLEILGPITDPVPFLVGTRRTIEIHVWKIGQRRPQQAGWTVPSECREMH